MVREVTFPSRKNFTMSSGSHINRGEGISLLQERGGRAVAGPPQPLGSACSKNECLRRQAGIGAGEENHFPMQTFVQC